MFRAYQLSLSDQGPWVSNDHTTAGTNILRSQETETRDALSRYMGPNSRIDASAMQAEWFPSIQADIFLSHSHYDQKEVLQLASWLNQTFGLNAFIDSAAWGHANDLLRQIDNHFCKNDDGNTYSYEKRNGTTAHVHAMLSAALLRMIDRTECLFFINTPRSLQADADTSGPKTYSAWIYKEISAAHIMRRLTPDQHRQMSKESSDRGRRVIAESRKFDPAYQLDEFLAEFITLSPAMLDLWQKHYRTAKLSRGSRPHVSDHPLDVLYSFTKTTEIQ